MVTETDAVARALDDAAQRWPEDASARSRLLLRLVDAGHRAVRGQQESDAARRVAAVRRTSGALTGVYRPDELARLRDDWPE